MEGVSLKHVTIMILWYTYWLEKYQLDTAETPSLPIFFFFFCAAPFAFWFWSKALCVQNYCGCSNQISLCYLKCGKHSGSVCCTQLRYFKIGLVPTLFQLWMKFKPLIFKGLLHTRLSLKDHVFAPFRFSSTHIDFCSIICIFFQWE